MRRQLIVTLLLAAAPLAAQRQDPSLLTVERIYSREFAPRFFGPTKWLDDSTYTTLEAASPNGGVALVRYDAASGRRSVLVGPEKLTPTGRSEPLDIDDYEWSHDHGKLLLFANTARVWRANTRGDYWVLDIASGRLKQVGGPSAKPSTLMFAKFSPEGGRVAYVREHDLYVESVADGRIVRLTHDGSKTMINGTFDWVYEEELSMRDG